MKSGRLLAGVFALTPFGILLATQPQTQKVSYATDVAPIFRAHCKSCHSGTDPAGKLDLSSAIAAMKGGASGKDVLVAKPDASILIKRMTGSDGQPRMPLGFPPVPKDDIDKIRAWIADGAHTEGADSAKHWAYMKPVRPPIPEVKNKAWVRNPIDNFVLARLEGEGLKPSPEAPKETLIRRVSLDLIGLPPSPQEIDAFLADKRPDAYERLVDRLLASQHYGERQARPWLDLARYADSDGYEKDLNRSAWEYRDWVINAFNRNLQYDQFTIQQLAGDIMPFKDRSQLVATGFNRNTMFNREGGVDQAEAHFNVVLDRVNTTATVWLGSTLRCAQCHDHKYDPFSQKDYYKMSAYFANSVIIPKGPANVSEEKWFESEMQVPTGQQVAEKTKLLMATAQVKREIDDKPADEKLKADQAQLKDLQKQMKQLEDSIPTTLIMRDKPTKGPLGAFIHTRGEFLNKAEPVVAGTPEVFGMDDPSLPSNRLGLAEWIASKSNPLTARVEVNRIWEQYFGRGIVETSEDFGTQGSRPTHPALLDWLATEFMRRDWDMKAMNRMIVLSATYRQSSNATPELIKRDPQNLLLARGPRFRLEAEMIRDLALSAGGMLDGKVGGPSVFPDQPAGTWDTPYNGEQWATSKGGDAYRRGLYTFWKRSAPYPSFMAFDATSREECTVRRIRTDTPTQALAMLNDDAVFVAAKALGQRMTKEGGATEKDHLVFGFRACTGRKPSPVEIKRLEQLLAKLTTRYESDPKAASKVGGSAIAAAYTMIANVLLNLDETLTKG